MLVLYIIALFMALQGVLLASVFLCAPYFRSLANRHLAYTFLAVSITGTNDTLLSNGYENKWLIFCNDIMWEYLFPATLLLYFVYGLRHPMSKQWQRWLLYAPFFVTLIINIVIDLDMEFGLYHLSWVDNETIIDTYYAIEDVGTIVFAIGTCTYSWFVVESYRPSIPSTWFRHFWRWSTSVVFLWILLWLMSTLVQTNLLSFVYAAVMALFSWVTYQGVLRFRLAEEKFEIRQILQDKPIAPPREETPTIDNPYLQRLEQLMQEQHLYRDPELSRDAIAKKLGISNGYLSQQLSKAGKRFSDYINYYRVEEVKQLLIDPAFQGYSLLAIGYEAGFNSKSTYYSAFKKATGLSPSAFRDQALSKS